MALDVVVILLTAAGALLAFVAFRRGTVGGPNTWRVVSGSRTGLKQITMEDWSVILVAAALAVVAAATLLSQIRKETDAREAILRHLAGDAASYRAWIDGQEITDPSALVAALRRLEHVSAHHSSPQRPRQIRIARGRERLTVIVARDSKVPDEYWVFLPGDSYGPYGELLGQSAGRVRTTAFQEIGL